MLFDIPIHTFRDMKGFSVYSVVALMLLGWLQYK